MFNYADTCSFPDTYCSTSSHSNTSHLNTVFHQQVRKTTCTDKHIYPTQRLLVFAHLKVGRVAVELAAVTSTLSCQFISSVRPKTVNVHHHRVSMYHATVAWAQ